MRQWILAATFALSVAGPAFAFDQSHATWDALLKRHVVVVQNGVASRADYAGFRADEGALQAYLKELSSVALAEYETWTRERKLAFLINAYNAFTVKLVLTRYPDLASIKDLGSFLRSPWKQKFFVLLGAERSLDDVEHGLIRAPGAFDEPRIHFAVNCASLGCPMLRAEAFVAERIEVQLDDGTRRFLADRERNRFVPASGVLEISKIFDWYREDFEKKSSRGGGSLPRFLASYADQLADGAAARALIREERAQVRFLDYDWKLNDAGR